MPYLLFSIIKLYVILYTCDIIYTSLLRGYRSGIETCRSTPFLYLGPEQSDKNGATLQLVVCYIMALNSDAFLLCLAAK